MNVHFIAIGGSIMHNLALTLKHKGYNVTGSDDNFFEPSKSRLQAAGILPKENGWFTDKITSNLDAVILGMHARKNNPELLKAQELGLKVYSFPEYMFEQTKNKKRIVIAGSHGKTTITSMILHVLNELNIKTDYLVGAQIEGFDRMVEINDSNTIAIFEGDEYLSSPLDSSPKFSHYDPDVLVISGIAWDHMNVFPTFESYLKPFNDIVKNLKKESSLIYFEEDEHLKKIIPQNANCKTTAYNAPNYTIVNNQCIVHFQNKQYALNVFGEHNLQNIEAARLACESINVTAQQFYDAIQSFTGSAKRLEKIKETNDFTFFRDFAHSPSKLTATINAVKEQFSERTVIACMELHTYSSLNKDFLSEYENSMQKADIKIIYFDPKVVALKKLPEINANDILEGFNDKNIKVFSSSEEVKKAIKSQEYNNSVLLMMSSGNFGGINYNDFAKELS